MCLKKILNGLLKNKNGEFYNKYLVLIFLKYQFLIIKNFDSLQISINKKNYFWSNFVYIQKQKFILILFSCAEQQQKNVKNRF